MTNKTEAAHKRAMRDLLAYEDTLTVDVEKTVQRIRERAKLLHTELDTYITGVLNDIKHKFEHELNRIHHTIDKLKSGGGGGGDAHRKRRSNSVDRTPRYQSTPRSSNIDFSLNSSHSTQVTYIDIDAEDQFNKKELMYYEGEASDSVYQKLVGHYTFDITSAIPFNPIQRAIQANQRSEVKLISTFRVGDKSETVHAIAPVDEDQAWVCCGWGSRNLALYDRHGQKRKSATLDIQVNDVTSFNDGRDDHVLISSYREKSIKRLNQESLRTSDFAYISLFPGGLCSDRRSGLYVCFRDSYQRTVTFGSRRMVAKLSKHGEIVSTIEKNEDQSNVFGYPFRIAVNVNGDVCVSDYGDGTRGVTILRKDGKVKCNYKGVPSGLSNEQPFLPHGIVCDGEGNIMVSDWNNDCIHVVDRDGTFLLKLVTKKDGVEGPNALGLDGNGHLWVGDSHGVVRVFKYSIFNH
ncbi:hypothetical protein DPMN_097579 [Dreissena polymorpha]|nr:hypothetical protein DPMN_097579 [Dreissena polymorpha]